MGISPPIIVLVRPQLGQNIGKAARAMLNFGLTEMRLVSPRDGWPNPDAGPSASGADVVLERAALFDSVAEGIDDCPTVYATTVRRRDVVLPVLTPEQMAVVQKRFEEAATHEAAVSPNSHSVRNQILARRRSAAIPARTVRIVKAGTCALRSV